MGGTEGKISVLGVLIAGGGVGGLFVGAVRPQRPGTVFSQPGDLHLVDHVAHSAGQQHGDAVPVQGEVGFAFRSIASGAGNHHPLSCLEGHGGNGPLHAVGGIVGQVDTLQHHGGGAGIVQLHPVAQAAGLVGDGAAVGGHNLADDNLRGLIAHSAEPGVITGLVVLIAGGGQGGFGVGFILLQRPGAVLTQLGDLHQGNGVAQGTGENHGAAAAGQGKIRISLAGRAACAADDGAFIGFQSQAFDHPLGPVLGVIGQEAAVQGDGFGAVVPQLHPVALMAVAVDDGVAVAGHDFTDDHLGFARALGLEPGFKARFGVFVAGGGLNGGGPAAVVQTNQRHIVVGSGNFVSVYHHVGAVVQADCVATALGNAEECVAVGVAFLVAPAYDVTMGLDHRAVGEGVADGFAVVGEHVAGDIDGRIRGVAYLDKVQVLAVGSRIGQVAGQNLA